MKMVSRKLTPGSSAECMYRLYLPRDRYRREFRFFWYSLSALVRCTIDGLCYARSCVFARPCPRLSESHIYVLH
ncbi:hypothetical protein RSAG8_05682, partial [Rhizoctonia solani AG-8 WAC10335]